MCSFEVDIPPWMVDFIWGNGQKLFKVNTDGCSGQEPSSKMTFLTVKIMFDYKFMGLIFLCGSLTRFGENSARGVPATL